MFKRYKNPFDKDLSSPLLDGDNKMNNNKPPQSSPYSPSSDFQQSQSTALQEPPPRIFDEAIPSSNLSKASGYSSSLDSLLDSQESNNEKSEVSSPSSQSFISKTPFQGEIPDTTLGEGVIFKGELTFERLLRIDGHFEGELLSEGKLIVGPKGIVRSNVKMREAVIEGKVEGNITVTERIELRGEAYIVGDIKARFLSVDEGVTIVGHVHVNPNESESAKQKTENEE